MEPGRTHSPRHPQWLSHATVSKSESNASAGAQSVESHDSVSAIGSHPFGTLHVHHATDDLSPLARSVVPEDDMPALDDVAGSSRQLKSSSAESQDLSYHRESLRHGCGGGDVVLILDLPELFIVGYDTISFTAKHFDGVRDIPAGAHFFWVAHPNGMSSRCGVCIMSSGVDRVHVLQWDRYNEVLCDSSTAEARIQADNVDTVHSKLVTYGDPEFTSQAGQNSNETKLKLTFWNPLAGAITEPMLQRITGQHGGAYFLHTADRVKGSLLMAAEVELDRRVSSAYLTGRELTFVFSQLSKTYSMDHVGSERTLEATDATPFIVSLLEPSAGITEQDIIGEFQFTFIIGAHLSNESCVQQWWHMLLHLILRAYMLCEVRPRLAAALLETIMWQIYHNTRNLETSILEQNDAQSRNLRLALTIYKRRLDDIVSTKSSPETLEVPAAFDLIESIVRMAPLEWELRSDNIVRKGKLVLEDGEEVELETAEFEAEDERGEWAPEVVEFDEQGREKGLVSWTD